MPRIQGQLSSLTKKSNFFLFLFLKAIQFLNFEIFILFYFPLMFNLVFYYDDIVITGGVKFLKPNLIVNIINTSESYFFNMFSSTFEGLLKWPNQA
jgi:hypothetical protein